MELRLAIVQWVGATEWVYRVPAITAERLVRLLAGGLADEDWAVRQAALKALNALVHLVRLGRQE